jgi:hypothetical protein
VPDTDSNEERVDQFIVYAAYGEIMHQFQIFELTLWRFLTRSIKSGTTLDQAMQKVEKWDATTLGKIVRGLKSQTHWPAGLIDELVDAVDARNYFAHHFLREYFMATPSERIKNEAVHQLAKVSVRLNDLQEALEAHLSSLGVPSIEDLDDETRADLQELRATEWLDDC